jgi:tetratricopeptide (TPR) repeat protein
LLKRSPSDSALWVRRGQAFLRADRLDEARTDFERALRINPNSAPALTGRAAIHLRRGSVAEAIQDANLAIQAQPDYAAYSLRGDAFLEQGDYDRAIDDYSEARRADSQVARAYLLRSEQRKAGGEIEQASADFEHAVSLDPSLSPEVAARLRADAQQNEAPRELPPLSDDIQVVPQE